jgi:hypothetical protein
VTLHLLQLDGTNYNESDSTAIGHEPIATWLLIATRREQIATRMSPVATGQELVATRVGAFCIQNAHRCTIAKQCVCIYIYMTYITSSTHITHIYHILSINVILHYIYNICSKCPSPQVHKCIKFVHTNPQVPQIHRNKFTTWSTKSKGLRWLLVQWERCERWHLSDGLSRKCG